MIDTHCHLSYEDYDNLDDIIYEMKKNNISAIVNGCELKSNMEVLDLCKNNNNLYPAIGFHPEEVDNIDNNYIEYIEKNIDKVVAIGEIGLDYHYTKENKDEQIKIFENQLKIAEKYNKPVIIHSRDAINDTYEILKKYNLKGSIHAFSGSLEMAKKFTSLGFKLGIGGVLTFKNCNLKDILKDISINDILLETDSPYMAPEPVRGKKNSPLNLKYIADFISKVKNISYEEVINITSDNAKSLFDL